MITLQSLHASVRERLSTLGLSTDDEIKCISAGDVFASVAVVSTAPGPAEQRTGIPFSGGAGHLLWDCLRPYGFTRNNVYLTNVVKRPLITSRTEEAASINKHELALWAEVLKNELSLLPNLQYIFVLGDLALQALTAHHGVMQWRGSTCEITLLPKPVQGLVSINPALVYRAERILRGEEDGRVPLSSARYIFQSDCRKFKLLTDGKLSPYIITHHINPTFSEAMDWITHLSSLDPDHPLSTDIEIANNETACVGFGLSEYEAFCINFMGEGGRSTYSLEEEANIRTGIHALFTSHRAWIAQNGMFDTTWLWYKDRIKLNVSFDTLLAHHTLYPDLPHSLAFLTSRYTNHPYYKSDKDDWRSVGDIDIFWRYNCKDCAITLGVASALRNELQRANLLDFFSNHVMRLQPYLAAATIHGVLVDVPYKDQVDQLLETEIGSLLVSFQRQAADLVSEPDYAPSPNSPSQLGELLFRRLKLVGRGSSTDETNRKRISQHPRTSEPVRELLRTLDQYKEKHKFFSTYIRTPIDGDGRFRSTWKQFGTQRAPGRLSSAKSPWGTGGNAQNQPSQAYPMYVADPGYSLFYFDLEQAEARVVGWLANIQKWINDFERARANPGSFDCHRSLASDMWNMPYEEVPASDKDQSGHFTLRYIAKRCRHGLNYRMAPARLAETTGLLPNIANEAYNKYHKLNPELRRWWTSLEDEVRKTKQLFNLYGRRWILTNPLTDATLESIVAFKPQSTVGDKVNRTIYRAQEDSKWPSKAIILMNIHDAVLGIAPHNQVDQALVVLKHHAEEPLHVPDRPPLIIPAECKRTNRSTSWRVIETETGSKQIEFYDDNTGYHRWSGLEKAKLSELYLPNVL